MTTMGYKKFLNNYFHYFRYFFGYLKYRLVLALLVSFFVGLLDGIGLALFIPLLKLISRTGSESFSGANQDFISSLILDKLNIQPSLINIFLLILFFFSLKGIAQFFEAYLRVVYQQFFMRHLRVENIDYLSRFDFQKFIMADAGRIQNTFSGEVSRVNTAYRFYIKSVQMSILVLVYIVLALGSDWKFTLLVMAGGFVLNHIFKSLYKQTKQFSRQYTEQNNLFQNLLLQKVHLFKYLKATGLNAMYGEKLKRNIYQIEGVQRKIGLIDALIAALREPLAILIVFVAILLNMYFFEEEMASILFSLILLYRAITYFMGMQEHYNLFLGVSGSIDNLESFTAELQAGEETSGTEIFHRFKTELKLKELNFSFSPEASILKNIDLEIHKNETLAIVGESGSGKTTLLNVISGLLLPTRGVYKIDGKPVQDLNINSFKKRIGYIVQDPTIFNDTIFNNVSFWAPKTEENYQRFLRAVKKAAISDFIEQLPEKEASLLGSNGINISGGQKQRLSIARELYKEVDFLFMDEATSALDSETEAAIQQNINQLKGKYTIILIAHRLATVRSADRIILMKNGRIKAEGDFSKLYSESEEFQEMVSHQNL